MITIDPDNNAVIIDDGQGRRTLAMDSPEAFDAASKAWLRCGWDTKYVYTFSWFGRPIIQLPEDLVRLQEVLYALKPDVILETGIAHGGSLVFDASICKAMGRGRVIGIDIDIRPHNRSAMENHELAGLITMIEGSSIDSSTVEEVRKLITPGESVLLVLDSNHSRDHVLAELEAYAGFVTPGSYAVVADGIMQDVVGAPRTESDWATNNPVTAVETFLKAHPEFVLEQPPWPFDESTGLRHNITYWKNGWLKRR